MRVVSETCDLFVLTKVIQLPADISSMHVTFTAPTLSTGRAILARCVQFQVQQMPFSSIALYCSRSAVLQWSCVLGAQC